MLLLFLWEQLRLYSVIRNVSQGRKWYQRGSWNKWCKGIHVDSCYNTPWESWQLMLMESIVTAMSHSRWLDTQIVGSMEKHMRNRYHNLKPSCLSLHHPHLNLTGGCSLPHTGVAWFTVTAIPPRAGNNTWNWFPVWHRRCPLSGFITNPMMSTRPALVVGYIIISSLLLHSNNCVCVCNVQGNHYFYKTRDFTFGSLCFTDMGRACTTNLTVESLEVTLQWMNVSYNHF